MLILLKINIKNYTGTITRKKKINMPYEIKIIHFAASIENRDDELTYKFLDEGIISSLTKEHKLIIMMTAAACSSVDILERMIDEGLDVNYFIPLKHLFFHSRDIASMVILRNDDEITEFMLSKGMKISQISPEWDNNGKIQFTTPLHLAAIKGNVTIAKLYLEKYGVITDDYKCESPLVKVATHNTLNPIEMAEIIIPFCKKLPKGICAYSYRNLKLFEYLISIGADPTEPEPISGMTALDLSYSRRDSELIDYHMKIISQHVSVSDAAASADSTHVDEAVSTIGDEPPHATAE